MPCMPCVGDALSPPPDMLWFSSKTAFPFGDLSRLSHHQSCHFPFLRQLNKETHMALPGHLAPLLKVKGMATSLLWSRNRTVLNITEVACWRTQLVFANHYMKPIQRVYDDVFTIRTIIIAGGVLLHQPLPSSHSLPSCFGLVSWHGSCGGTTVALTQQVFGNYLNFQMSTLSLCGHFYP